MRILAFLLGTLTVVCGFMVNVPTTFAKPSKGHTVRERRLYCPPCTCARYACKMPCFYR